MRTAVDPDEAAPAGADRGRDSTTTCRGDYTVLDVYHRRPRRPAVHDHQHLYHLWIEIHLAKITTMVDQVLDVFYVTDAEGRKIEDPAHLEQIRQEPCGRSRLRRRPLLRAPPGEPVRAASTG